MTPKIIVNRDLLKEDDLDEYRITKKRLSCTKIFSYKLKKMFTLKNMPILQRVEYFIPIVLWIRTYEWKKWLKDDIISGLTVGIMQISQGLAYGELAGLEPITGLYVSFIPGLIYACLGTSRYVHLGTFAVVSLLVSSVMNSQIPIEYARNKIVPNVNDTLTPENILAAKYVVSATLTITVGLIQLILYTLNAGMIAKFLSPTIVHGFTFAVALQVFSSQVSTVVGIKIPINATEGSYGLVVQKYIYLFKNISRTNIAALIIALISILIILVVKHLNERYNKILKIPIPGDLLLIIITTGISYGCKFNQKYNVPIVGKIPSQLPSVVLPDFSILPEIGAYALVIAVVTFAVDVSIAKQLNSQEEKRKRALKSIRESNKSQTELVVRPNQELLALSIANILSSFFKCYVAGSSLARSVVHSNIGHSQMFTFIANSAILIVLLCASKLFYHLPKAILAAVVISALVPVFKKITQLKIYWKNSKREFFLWIFTVLSVFLIGIEIGLGISVLLSLTTFIYNIMIPQHSTLAPIDNDDDIYKDTKLFNTKTIENNIAIFCFKCPLFYLNNEIFYSNVENIVHELVINNSSSDKQQSDHANGEFHLDEGNQSNDTVVQSGQQQPTKYHIIIDMSYVSFVDMASYDVINKLQNFSITHDTTMYYCSTTDEITQGLRKCSISLIFPTILDAVTFVRSTINRISTTMTNDHQ